jgi:hypothetical protein
VWNVTPVLGIAAILTTLALSSCSDSDGSAASGVHVTFTNSDRTDVTLYDCPRSLCDGVAKLSGCRNPACSAPKDGEAEGSLFGWTETREMPYRYHLTLRGEPLRCPPASGPPSSWPNPANYAVNYDITPSGRCIIYSHVRLIP